MKKSNSETSPAFVGVFYWTGQYIQRVYKEGLYMPIPIRRPITTYQHWACILTAATMLPIIQATSYGLSPQMPTSLSEEETAGVTGLAGQGLVILGQALL